MIFAQAVKPRPIKDKLLRVTTIINVVIFTFMVFLQLFNFENFFEIIAQYHLPVSDSVCVFFGGLIVFMEIFALPPLLNMALSRLMRAMSLLFVALVPLFWLTLVGFGVHNGLSINSGVLGDVMNLPVSGALFVALLGLYGLALYNVYRLMAPLRARSRRRGK